MSADRFLQVEVGLPRSKLIDAARQKLDGPRSALVGCFVMLWAAALTLRTRGKIGDRSDQWIEEEAGWTGTPGAFAKFVREYHLDHDGVIRDFTAKYGKLDVDRDKATRLKQLQREREREAREAREASGGQEGASPVDRDVGVEDVHPTDSGLSGDRPAKASISLSVSRSDLALTEAFPEKKPFALGILQTVLDRFGEPHARWPLGLVRSSRNPEAVAAGLFAHLDGMHGPEYAPEVVALAAQEWVASEDSASGFKPRLFAGYVRRAESTIKMTVSRKQQQNETRYIAGEAEERDRVGEEEARLAAELEAFRVEDPHKFSELMELAERRVPSKVTGMFRTPMVRAELLTLIREEVKRAAV